MTNFITYVAIPVEVSERGAKGPTSVALEPRNEGTMLMHTDVLYNIAYIAAQMLREAQHKSIKA